MNKHGFFKDDSGSPSMTRLQMFMGFLLAAFYLVFNVIKALPIDVFILLVLLGYSGSVKVIQKFAEMKGKDSL